MQRKKKILIHSLVFSPDGVSTAYLYRDIALQYKNCGYDVVVLTTVPHYNVIKNEVAKQHLKWKFFGFCKVSSFDGISVYHVPQKKFKSTVLRIFGFIYWHIVSFFIILSIKNIDVILSPSPPLTIGVINIIASKLKKCKTIYNVQEIYPDILGKSNGIVFRTLKKMERFVYKESSAVTTIDQVFYDTIKERFINESILKIIPNFVDTSIYHPISDYNNQLDNDLFPINNALKIIYAGNIGYAQDWDTLLALAELTKDDNIEYFVIGEGVMKAYLTKHVETLRLRKLHIISYLDRSLIPSVLSYSDIQFIFMNKNMEMQGFPSKVYTIMACSKPLLVCSSQRTPIVRFLSKYGCAKIFSDTSSNANVENMAIWLHSVSKKELEIMGVNGLSVIKSSYSKEMVTMSYVDLTNNLLGDNC